jgi:hypothetical protein
MDFVARQMAFEQTESLRRLSRQVLTQLELRRKLIDFEQALKELDHAHLDLVAEKARTEELLKILPAYKNPEDFELVVNGRCKAGLVKLRARGAPGLQPSAAAPIDRQPPPWEPASRCSVDAQRHWGVEYG